MICPKCGKTNDDGVTSCAFCGAKFTAMSAEVKKESGGFFQKHKTLVIVAIVLVILIAGGSVAGYFINASKKSTKQGADAFSIDASGVLTSYAGPGGDVVIPDEVKEIGPGAFQNNDTITSVVIPKHVTAIGASAFEDCSKLTKVIMPEQLESLPNALLRAAGI